MSERVEEIRCRLCATSFPETDRFCPNCREPRPDVHEDLLMAARMTGISYEILLQRAWAEDGLIRIRQPSTPTAETGTAPIENVDQGFVQRIIGKRDTATVGCMVLFAIVFLILVGAAIIIVVRDNLGSDDNGGEQAAQPTLSPTATPTPTPPEGGAGVGTAAGDGGGQGGAGAGTSAPTPDVRLLILNPAIPATFSDDSQIRLIATNLSVISSDGSAAPESGFRFVAIQVEVCAGSEALASAPGHWQLEMPDSSRYLPVTPVALPNIESTTLASNDCNSGWITFETPVTDNPAYVLMSNPSHETIRYAWPE